MESYEELVLERKLLHERLSYITARLQQIQNQPTGSSTTGTSETPFGDAVPLGDWEALMNMQAARRQAASGGAEPVSNVNLDMSTLEPFSINAAAISAYQLQSSSSANATSGVGIRESTAASLDGNITDPIQDSTNATIQSTPGAHLRPGLELFIGGPLQRVVMAQTGHRSLDYRQAINSIYLMIIDIDGLWTEIWCPFCGINSTPHAQFLSSAEALKDHIKVNHYDELPA